MKMRDKIVLLEKRIEFLESRIRVYYNAVFDLCGMVDWSSQNMMHGITFLGGASEQPVIDVDQRVKDAILNLPLEDCGIC